MPDRTSRPSRPRRHRRLAAAALASATLLAAPAAAHAAGWVEGPEFSTGPWAMAQDLAGAPDGSSTLVWLEAPLNMRTPAETPAPRVKVQRAFVNGTVGPVSDVGATDERYMDLLDLTAELPVVATGAGGATAVAWTYTPDAGDPEVKLAFIGASGEPGQVVTVGDALEGDPLMGGTSAPLSLGLDGGGAATVVWEGPDPRNAAGSAVLAARVAPDGTFTTTAVAPLREALANPQVAVAPSGVAWIAWSGAPSDPDDDAQVARLAPDGTLDDPESIGERTSGAAVTAGANGAVAAATDTRTGGLVGVRLSATGPLLAGAFQAPSSAPAPDPTSLMPVVAVPAALALGPDGTVTIARTVADGADFTSIRFDYVRIPAGATTGSPQSLAEPPAGGSAYAPALASAPDGTVLATWAQTRRGIAITAPTFARIVAPNGSLGPNLNVGAQSVLPTLGGAGAAGSPLMPAISDAGAAMIGVSAGISLGPSLPIGGFETRVLDARPPVVEANVPATAVAGTPVAFSATASDPAGVQLFWDFGDDSGSPRASVTHRYLDPGTYTVTLVATDGANNQTVVTRKLTVTSPVGPLARRAAALKVARAIRRGTRVVVNGTIAAGASGTVTIVYSQRIGRRTFTARKSARIARGRWVTTLRLTGRLARATGRAKVTVSYRGDADTQGATATRAVTKVKPKPKKPAKHKKAKSRR